MRKWVSHTFSDLQSIQLYSLYSLNRLHSLYSLYSLYKWTHLRVNFRAFLCLNSHGLPKTFLNVQLVCISSQSSTSLQCIGSTISFSGCPLDTVQTFFDGCLRWVWLWDDCCQKPFVETEWGWPLRYLLNNRIGCFVAFWLGRLNIHQVCPINTYLSAMSYTTAISITSNIKYQISNVNRQCCSSDLVPNAT